MGKDHHAHGLTLHALANRITYYHRFGFQLGNSCVDQFTDILKMAIIHGADGKVIMFNEGWAMLDDARYKPFFDELRKHDLIHIPPRLAKKCTKEKFLSPKATFETREECISEGIGMYLCLSDNHHSCKSKFPSKFALDNTLKGLLHELCPTPKIFADIKALLEETYNEHTFSPASRQLTHDGNGKKSTASLTPQLQHAKLKTKAHPSPGPRAPTTITRRRSTPSKKPRKQSFKSGTKDSKGGPSLTLTIRTIHPPPRSPASRSKSQPRARRVAIKDANGKTNIYASVREAARALDIHSSSVHRQLTGEITNSRAGWSATYV